MHQHNLDLVKGLEVKVPDFLVKLIKSRAEAGKALNEQIQLGSTLAVRIKTEKEKLVREVTDWHERNKKILVEIFDSDLVHAYYIRTIASPLSLAVEGFDAENFAHQIDERVIRLRAISGLPCFLPEPDHSLLSKSFIHPELQSLSWVRYLEKDYPGAVFEAYKQLEIHLRASSGINIVAANTAVPLARQAFKDNANGTAGPLTDTSLPAAEQEAIGHLVAGAFGIFRNGPGHRNTSITADEALSQILLANYLMNYIDDRVRAIASVSASPTP